MKAHIGRKSVVTDPESMGLDEKCCPACGNGFFDKIDDNTFTCDRCGNIITRKVEEVPEVIK